jgi:hypothetical protein
MTSRDLIDPVRAARIGARAIGGSGRRWRAGSVLGALALGGCITVKAPDKPIVIELNVNIRQEVIYRLAEDAGNTIQQNPEIF